jgi:hypothetical protein
MRREILFVFIIGGVLAGCASGGYPTQEQLASNTFAECPREYQAAIQARLSANLIDPESARFRFSTPRKYVYSGQFGQIVAVGLNAKNRFGGYVGEQVHEFMCFPDGSLREINEIANGMRAGLGQAGY